MMGTKVHRYVPGGGVLGVVYQGGVAGGGGTYYRGRGLGRRMALGWPCS